MGGKTTAYLTKSRYVSGLECHKRMWLMFNSPDALPKVDRAGQYRIYEGRMIGMLARGLFSGGIEAGPATPAGNDKESRQLLDRRKTVFEAGFVHPDGRCYARADILVPAPGGTWDIVEVKSAAGVKGHHIHDVSFQRYCYEGAGIPIRKCFILHVNGKYVRGGEVDPHGLLTKTDVTGAVDALMPGVPSNVKGLLGVAALKRCPEFGRGEEYHSDPDGVHDGDRIWGEHPGADIMHLAGGADKVQDLMRLGVFRIRDIPDGFELNDKQSIQRDAHASGRPHVDRTSVSSFINGLEYPLYFLDFETYGSAIPLYDGTRPYQQIPFQFSVHVLEREGAQPSHISFIARGRSDPRPSFADALRHSLGASGSIVVYNQSFEEGIVREIARTLPDYGAWAASAAARMADLLGPFRSFAYYSPAQNGSASLKKVLPALTGATYDGFEIANGFQASLAYLFMTHGRPDGSSADPEEERRVRASLEKYCGQDTEGMVWILQRLRAAASSGAPGTASHLHTTH